MLCSPSLCRLSSFCVSSKLRLPRSELLPRASCLLAIRIVSIICTLGSLPNANPKDDSMFVGNHARMGTTILMLEKRKSCQIIVFSVVPIAHGTALVVAGVPELR